MDKQTVRIEEGGVIFADYDGPVTRFKVRNDDRGTKITIWLPPKDGVAVPPNTLMPEGYAEKLEQYVRSYAEAMAAHALFNERLKG